MPVLIAAGHVILFPESGTFLAALVPFSSQCQVLSPNHALIEGNLGQFRVKSTNKGISYLESKHFGQCFSCQTISPDQLLLISKQSANNLTRMQN